MQLKPMPHLKPPIPKEHGSWAMFMVPLLLGFIIASTWQWSSLVLIVAALGFFLVRYPLALLVKTRNRKRTNSDKAHLWRWTLIYGGLTVLSGAWLVLVRQLWWLIPLGIFGGQEPARVLTALFFKPDSYPVAGHTLPGSPPPNACPASRHAFLRLPAGDRDRQDDQRGLPRGTDAPFPRLYGKRGRDRHQTLYGDGRPGGGKGWPGD